MISYSLHNLGLSKRCSYRFSWQVSTGTYCSAADRCDKLEKKRALAAELLVMRLWPLD